MAGWKGIMNMTMMMMMMMNMDFFWLHWYHMVCNNSSVVVV